MADDLDNPLGLGPQMQPSHMPVRVLGIAAGVLTVIVAFAVAWVALIRDPLGGEPFAVAAIGKSTDIAAADKPKQLAGVPGPARTITVIDGKSGERKDVVVRDVDDAPVGSTVNLEAKVTERSRHGLLPRTSVDGTRPLDVFAAVNARDEFKGPRVAIVVGGLGISASATADAIDRLAPTVTLAFAPYGADLPLAVARARGIGHEILLQ
ncbi:MAG TPA: divergent polysaccharide deacetylase family protein, partial [Xanthobacteraceae bacterium]|nr:divergent polysaccharide deacetylase family protein [Xanthobacteraceae bacterium]